MKNTAIDQWGREKIRILNQESVSVGYLPSPLVSTSDQFRWLLGITKSIIILNLLDSLFTLCWVHTGVAEEANILLKDLVNNHAVVFMAVKITLVSLGSLILWKRRRHLIAVMGLYFVFMVYLFTLFYHLQFSHHLVSLITLL